EPLAVVEVDQPHPLGRSALLPHLGDARADQDSAGGDEHDPVLGIHSWAAISLPLRSLHSIAIIPCVPRPCRVYSESGVRLPKPFSVAVSTDWLSSAAVSNEMTRWPACSFIPRTPVAPRPMARTSSSAKRTALPASENSITSCLPSVNATPIRWSPSSRFTAMMPFAIGRENADSAVFLTVPIAVAMNT